MLKKLMENLLVLFFIIILMINSIIANCMSARSTSSDADCYLNHLARENVMRMGMEGGCESPRQQVVYPDDNTKMYMPRGTLLYRCNDQSGCCPQKEHTCQSVQEEDLRVAFYSMDCNAGDSRPQPEYLMMKNHTKCGCRPPTDDSFDPSPQRLQDMVCGSGRSGQQIYGQNSGYGQSGGNGRNGGQSRGYGGQSYGGGYGGQSYGGGFGSQYAGSQQSMSSMSSPCSNSMSSRPLVDGQVVRGTIRLTVGPKGFSMQNQQQQQQQPCPYG